MTTLMSHTQDYESKSLTELKAICSSVGVSVYGTKKTILNRLVKNGTIKMKPSIAEVNLTLNSKKDDIVAACRRRNLPVTGNKGELLARVKNYDAQHGVGKQSGQKVTIQKVHLGERTNGTNGNVFKRVYSKHSDPLSVGDDEVSILVDEDESSAKRRKIDSPKSFESVLSGIFEKNGDSILPDEKEKIVTMETDPERFDESGNISVKAGLNIRRWALDKYFDVKMNVMDVGDVVKDIQNKFEDVSSDSNKTINESQSVINIEASEEKEHESSKDLKEDSYVILNQEKNESSSHIEESSQMEVEDDPLANELLACDDPLANEVSTNDPLSDENDGPKINEYLESNEKDDPKIIEDLESNENDDPKINKDLESNENGPKINEDLESNKNDDPKINEDLESNENDDPKINEASLVNNKINSEDQANDDESAEECDLIERSDDVINAKDISEILSTGDKVLQNELPIKDTLGTCDDENETTEIMTSENIESSTIESDSLDNSAIESDFITVDDGKEISTIESNSVNDENITEEGDSDDGANFQKVSDFLDAPNSPRESDSENVACSPSKSDSGICVTSPVKSDSEIIGTSPNKNDSENDTISPGKNDSESDTISPAKSHCGSTLISPCKNNSENDAISFSMSDAKNLSSSPSKSDFDNKESENLKPYQNDEDANLESSLNNGKSDNCEMPQINGETDGDSAEEEGNAKDSVEEDSGDEGDSECDENDDNTSSEDDNDSDNEDIEMEEPEEVNDETVVSVCIKQSEITCNSVELDSNGDIIDDILNSIINDATKETKTEEIKPSKNSFFAFGLFVTSSGSAEKVKFVA